MLLLAFFLVLFAVVHVTPALPTWKAAAVAQLGKAYGAVYGIVSLLMLIAAVWAFRQADVVPLYEPAVWARHANFAITLIGFLFIGIFLFRGSWRNRVKYPMAIGICIWAAGHLLANGDTRTTLLFAGLAATAALHAFLKSRQAFVPSEARNGHNMLSILGGIVLYGLAAQLHMVIAGVPLVTLQ